MKKIYLALGILVVVVVLTGAYKKIGALDLPLDGAAISQEAAKEKALAFVKKNLVQEGTEVSVKSITEKSGLYEMVLDIQGTEYPTYITKDGSTFIKEAINISDFEKKLADSKKAEEEAESSIPKSDRPVVDLYVMSFCPYGNKAEDTIAPVYALLKDKVDFNFRYIVDSEGDAINSLHGQPEVDQNIREACVLKEYGKDAWMNFATYVNANCGSNGSCWEDGAKSQNIDTFKISSCAKNQGVALMKADEKASNEAGATGSPTMLINGSETRTVYQYGNAEAYKDKICSTFNNAPEECNKELSAETSTAAGGSCN